MTDAGQGRRRAPEALWPPRFEAAIFDFDGTIADTAAVWREVDLAFLGQRGLEFTDDYSRALSALGFEAGARYTIERFGLKERPEDICAEWNRMGRALYRTRVALRPGAEAYIRALRAAHVPCALAPTNDPDVLAAAVLLAVAISKKTMAASDWLLRRMPLIKLLTALIMAAVLISIWV